MPVLLERCGPVLIARIDNPPTDLLDAAVMADLDRLGRRLKHDPDVRAVVITGPRPGVFVPHYDIAEIQAGTEALGLPTPYPVARVAYAVASAVSVVPPAAALVRRTPAGGLVSIAETHRTLSRFARLRQVIVAAIDGDAMGGGCELALACDLRVMSDGDHRIGLPELSAGIPPGAGGTQRLMQAVGPARALAMILRARTVEPKEALRIGLVDQVTPASDTLATAIGIAQQAAAWNPDAVLAAKRAVRGTTDRVSAGGLRREAAGFVSAVSGREALTRLRQFTAASDTATGRTPWRDRSIPVP